MIGGQTYVNNIEARKHGANNAFHKANTVMNSHREPLLPNAPGWDTLWEEASPEEERNESSATNVSHRCGKEGGETTWYLVSVLGKRGMNRIKQAYLY